MILLHDQQIAIMTPPKCASNSIHAALRMPPWNGETFVGPNTTGSHTLDKHMNKWPHEAMRYRKVISVRNPYNRIVSLYLHYCSRRAGTGFESPSFKEYVRLVVTEDQSITSWYSWNLSRWLEGLECDDFIRTENIVEDIKVLGIQDIVFPFLNKNYRAQRYVDFYNDEIKKMVFEWCEMDCKMFNYPHECHIYGTWN